jgi:N-acetylmuramoyl-L-alanine amidase
MVKIYLDAGHGGTDSGAVGNGLLEKNVTLDIIKRIDALLRANYKDVEITQTRTTDVFLTLDERTNRANNWKADVFLAVHINSGPTSARGFESHIYTDVGPDTKAFQNVMHENIFGQVRADGVTDRGKKQSNFHVLRESHMISILTENLFVSNSADALLLKSAAFLDKIALGHVQGLEKFFGLTKTIPPPSDTAMFQVIAGTFSQKENAEELIKKLVADGYKPYIFKKD